MARTDPRPHYGKRIPQLTAQGYIKVYDPKHPLAMKDGYVLQHRQVAWDAGIIYRREQQVHHVDGDKTNNEPTNLEPTWNGEHQELHARQRLPHVGQG